MYLNLIGCFEEKQNTHILWTFLNIQNAQKIEVILVAPKESIGFQKLENRIWAPKPDSCKQNQYEEKCWFSKQYPDSTFQIKLNFNLKPSTVIEPNSSEKHLLQSLIQKTHQKLKYLSQNQDISLDSALKLGSGDCTQFTDLLIAYCKEEHFQTAHLRGLLKNEPHSFAMCKIKNQTFFIDPTLKTLISNQNLEQYFILSGQKNSFPKNNYEGSALYQIRLWGSPLKPRAKIQLKVVS
jgi:hypothetical protein